MTKVLFPLDIVKSIKSPSCRPEAAASGLVNKAGSGTMPMVVVLLVLAQSEKPGSDFWDQYLLYKIGIGQ